MKIIKYKIIIEIISRVTMLLENTLDVFLTLMRNYISNFYWKQHFACKDNGFEKEVLILLSYE